MASWSPAGGRCRTRRDGHHCPEGIDPMSNGLQTGIQTANYDRTRRDERGCRTNGVMVFLIGVLTPGPLAVADLEGRARGVGLLGDRQRITDAKSFKAAKKLLR